MKTIAEMNGMVNGFVWGPIMLILLVGTGIYFSIRLKLFQVTKIGLWMKNTLGTLFRKEKKVAAEGAISPFQALTTALAATVGTGNIVGVTTAIVSGGPGAVFWMWISAFFGMMTKYAEIVLAVQYRKRNAQGEWVGGPMYYIREGLGKKFGWLAGLFAAFGMLASFGIGNMTQVNSIASSLETVMVDFGVLSHAALDGEFSLFRFGIGIVLALLAGLVIIGGLKRIGAVTEKLVPFMSIVYVLGALVTVIANAGQILPAFASIFRSAFTVQSAAGGVLGYTVGQAMRYGVARGVFSNEAGLGSAPIAHAAADTDSPVKQGMWGVFEVFVDTIIICSLTALVVLTSGLYTGDPSGLTGAPLVSASMGTAFGKFGSLFVAVAISLFAFSTLLSWSLYGKRCFEFLLKDRSALVYQILFLAAIVIASVMQLTLVWDIADTLNGLMAIPNLIGLLALSGLVIRLTKEYLKGGRSGQIEER